MTQAANPPAARLAHHDSNRTINQALRTFVGYVARRYNSLTRDYVAAYDLGATDQPLRYQVRCNVHPDAHMEFLTALIAEASLTVPTVWCAECRTLKGV